MSYINLSYIALSHMTTGALSYVPRRGSQHQEVGSSARVIGDRNVAGRGGWAMHSITS
jgi:hypothetical protein